MRSKFAIVAGVIAALLLVACDGSNGGTSAPAANNPTVTTQHLAIAIVGSSYNQALGASGGNGNFTWSLSTGSLPAGITLNAAALAGTPTSAGVFDFTLSVTDGAGASDAQPFSLTVNPPLSVLTSTLNVAVQGSGYGEIVEAFGGSGAGFTWGIAAGALPSGLILGATGTPWAGINGAPTASGTANFTVRVTDSLGNTATRALALSVNAPLAVTSMWLHEAVVGVPYSSQVFASNGTQSGYTWGVQSGNLPLGLSVLQNGTPYTILQGVPQTTGNNLFTLQTQDSGTNSATRQLEMRVYAPGTILTAAGNGLAYTTGQPNGDGGPAALASFNGPSGIAFDALGNLYIAERSGYRVRKVDAQTGFVSTIAGDGTLGTAGGLDSIFPASPPRQALTAKFVGLSTLQIRGNDLYMLDTDGGAIHRMNLLTGVIVTVAGTGVPGFSGDNGAATAAQFNVPYTFGVAQNGDIYIVDTFNYRIRKVTASTGNIATICGDGTPDTTGDNGPAISARIQFMTGLCVDNLGNVFIGGGSSTPPDVHTRVRKIDVAGVITTVAGTGAQGYSGDGGLATAATFNRPASLCVDAQGNLYICDMRVSGTGNNRVRKVDATTGIITTVAGNGTGGFSGDGGLGTTAQVWSPFTPTIDGRGNLYFCDSNNARVRKVLKP